MRAAGANGGTFQFPADVGAAPMYPKSGSYHDPSVHGPLPIRRLSAAGGKSFSMSADHYTGRFTFFTLIVIIAGAMTGLLLGYDNGVMGGVQAMESFQAKFFNGPNSVYEHNYGDLKSAGTPYCKYNNQIYQVLISCLYLAAGLSAVVTEVLARQLGRKPCMVFAGFMFTAGAAVLAASPNLGCLFAGRAILGVGVGAGTMVGPLYLAEMAPAKIRGSLNVLFQLMVTIGILIAGLINYGCQYIHHWGWRLPLALAGVPGIFLFFAGIMLPESPNSLAERRHYGKAAQVLRKIRGVQDIAAEYSDIVYAARQSNLIKNPYWNLISKKKYRPQLIIAIIFMIFQQFDGINAIIFYAPILFDSLASGALGGLLNTVIIDCVNVLATIPAIVLVDKLGRRILLMVAAAWMFVAQIVVAIVLAVQFRKYGTSLPQSDSIGILVVICVYICGHAFGWGPIGWLFPVEAQPLETRAAGAGINTASNMLFTFVIGQSFTTMLCSMEYGVFLFFAGCLVFMGMFTYFMFPETKGIPVENTHAVFKTHPIWSKLFPEVAEVQTVDAGPQTDIPEVALRAGGITSYAGLPGTAKV